MTQAEARAALIAGSLATDSTEVIVTREHLLIALGAQEEEKPADEQADVSGQ